MVCHIIPDGRYSASGIHILRRNRHIGRGFIKCIKFNCIRIFSRCRFTNVYFCRRWGNICNSFHRNSDIFRYSGNGIGSVLVIHKVYICFQSKIFRLRITRCHRQGKSRSSLPGKLIFRGSQCISCLFCRQREGQRSSLLYYYSSYRRWVVNSLCLVSYLISSCR